VIHPIPSFFDALKKAFVFKNPFLEVLIGMGKCLGSACSFCSLFPGSTAANGWSQRALVLSAT